MPLSGVIFDLDGTLADTLADIGGALNAVLAARGLPVHPLPDYCAFVGEGIELLVGRALPSDRQALLPEVLAEYRAYYGAHLVERSAPYEGVPALLDALQARGVRLGILSNKPDAPTREIARLLFSRWPFGAVAGSRPEVPRKPDPRGALEIAAALSLEPAQCAFVGDTWIDIATARAAGMRAVGVSWGFRAAEELRKAGAEVVLAHPLELLALFP